jgi:hypothetical protein
VSARLTRPRNPPVTHPGAHLSDHTSWSELALHHSFRDRNRRRRSVTASEVPAVTQDRRPSTWCSGPPRPAWSASGKAATRTGSTEPPEDATKGASPSDTASRIRRLPRSPDTIRRKLGCLPLVDALASQRVTNDLERAHDGHSMVNRSMRPSAACGLSRSGRCPAPPPSSPGSSRVFAARAFS